MDAERRDEHEAGTTKILCKFFKDPALGSCPRGLDCEYSHLWWKFDPSTFEYVESDEEDAGEGDEQEAQAAAETAHDDAEWGKPVGHAGRQELVLAGARPAAERSEVCVVRPARQRGRSEGGTRNRSTRQRGK